MLKRVMQKFNIPNLFREVITFFDLEDPEKGKPHPFSIEEILKRTGFRKEETIFVGDSENDVLTAKNAGIIPIVVLTGHLTREQALDLGVKHIIPDVTHLVKVLDKLK